MKPYSVDLRQKVIDAYNQQEGFQCQLAKRFRVSLSFIQDLLKRYRSDGTIEPRAHGGGHSASFSPEQRDVVAQLVAARNDATLEELSVLVGQHIGVQVSRSTMGRVVQQLNLTWKKTLHATERDTERVQRLLSQNCARRFGTNSPTDSP